MVQRRRWRHPADPWRGWYQSACYLSKRVRPRRVSDDPRLETRLLQYHALLHHRHGLPVETTVVLLRPEADRPGLSGRYERRGHYGNVTMSFGYQVVRLWGRP